MENVENTFYYCGDCLSQELHNDGSEGECISCKKKGTVFPFNFSIPRYPYKPIKITFDPSLYDIEKHEDGLYYPSRKCGVSALDLPRIFNALKQED